MARRIDFTPYLLPLLSDATEEVCRKRFLACRMIEQAFLEDRALFRQFTSPMVSVETRKEVLARVLKERVDQTVLALVIRLLEEEHLASFPKCVRAFERLLSKLKIGEEIVVQTAEALNAEERDALQAQLEKEINMSVMLREEVDEKMIGGMRLISRDWLFDSTVRGRLTRLTHALTQS
jgi:F-type H+-transporting ATPase subunit delta